MPCPAFNFFLFIDFRKREKIGRGTERETEREREREREKLRQRERKRYIDFVVTLVYTFIG